MRTCTYLFVRFSKAGLIQVLFTNTNQTQTENFYPLVEVILIFGSLLSSLLIINYSVNTLVMISLNGKSFWNILKSLK